MREFVVYTALRLLLLAATFGIVVGVWALGGGAPNLFVAVLIAFVVSGAGSWFLLQRPRSAFAQRVEARAERMTSSIEALRTKEDDLADSSEPSTGGSPGDRQTNRG